MTQELSQPINTKLREAAALMLWQKGAIKINAEKPFKLASGMLSPIYVNCRQVISDPIFIGLFTSAARMTIKNHNIFADIVAGGETAGIPFASFLSERVALPMVYIRKSVKGYGIASLIEGCSVKDKRVLLVEDLITDAGSKLNFIQAVQADGGDVKDVLVLFDRKQGGEESLAKFGVRLHSITDLNTALKVCDIYDIANSETLREVFSYLENPADWNDKRNK